jgi:hypothetical protein
MSFFFAPTARQYPDKVCVGRAAKAIKGCKLALRDRVLGANCSALSIPAYKPFYPIGALFLSI